MEKIANLGCSTTILTILQNMYRNAVSVVCLDGEHSAWSTPVQFVFLSDLEEFLEDGEMEGASLAYFKLQLLLFAA